jgi:hypothetical protein
MRLCAVLILCALLLTGCAPVAREPDNLMLVRVLGVDGGSPTVLTAVCARDNQGEVGRGSAEAENFEQARRQIPWSGSAEELSLTGVSYLVIGPEVDLENLLYSVLEDADLGAVATVWKVATGAAAALEACEDPAADLELLMLQGIKAPTVAQAVAALSGAGEVSLPCLVVRNGKLKEQGVCRWQTDN